MKVTKKKQIVIIGAGLIGSTMAIALASKGFDVTVVDGAKNKDRIERNKGRTYALSRTSKNLLFNLGLWDPKKLNVSPIKNITLSTKKESNDLICHLAEFNEANSSIDPSSYMIEDFYLRKALASEIDKNTKIQLFDSLEVIQEKTNSFETKIMLSDKSSISTEILIISDGRESSFAKRLNKRFFSKSYNQVAIVGNLSHDNAHNFIAHQIFLSGGPLAILPLQGKRSTFVWSLPVELGKKLTESKGEKFTNYLKENTGDILTNPSLIGAKKMFPLYLRFLRDSIDNRKIFIGDSSQAVHPLAGQGLNIGLRDVASLVDTLLKGKRLGLDLGGIDLLKSYESWRSFDRISLATYTDLINSIFSNNNFYLKAIREFGMNAIDKSQLLKSFFTKEAAGEYGDLPDLLKP
ncbi:FAD-dependent monooxygenase [Paracoccaceae bacterium]|nr:FAD-dependent monooxygenase [Paracoccaceae bacterium]